MASVIAVARCSTAMKKTTYQNNMVANEKYKPTENILLRINEVVGDGCDK
jgi:predicted secreted protein